MKRRQFITNSAAVVAGTFILPRFSIGQSGPSANSRLNIAMIGAGGIANMAYSGLQGENIVALADVDSSKFLQHAQKFPHLKKARQFADYREMLDKMGNEIDAVCINTPDHTHFHATLTAMEHGMHVCPQKPLTHNIWEARTLRKAMKKYDVQTNMAVQGHTFDGIRQMREWYEADVFGQIREVHSWIPGPNWSPLKANNAYWRKAASYPPPVDPVPSNLDYDLWLGSVAGEHPYHNTYHPRSWRAYHAFGNGIFGDWFPHIADAPVWVLDLYEPVVVEAEEVSGGNEWVVPDGNRVRFEFKKRGTKEACNFYWYNGDEKFRPKVPKEWTWGNKLPNMGTIYYGDKLVGYSDQRSNNPRLADKEKMREFKASGFPEEKYSRIKGGPFAEWVRAIKGEGPEAGANFEYSSRFTEMMLIGSLAARFGGRIEWDPNRGITNRPELNAYVREPVRPGWEIGYDLWT